MVYRRDPAACVLLMCLLCCAHHATGGYFQPLGNLPNVPGAVPSAVSADGSVVVGTSGDTWLGPSEAFRWTSSSGMVGLGGHMATDVSADGSVVVGCCYSGQAFRWTGAGGMEAIGVGLAEGVSDDGSVVVGSREVA
jgi:probable HAF family extracellular repeat protein